MCILSKAGILSPEQQNSILPMLGSRLTTALGELAYRNLVEIAVAGYRQCGYHPGRSSISELDKLYQLQRDRQGVCSLRAE